MNATLGTVGLVGASPIAAALAGAASAAARWAFAATIVLSPLRARFVLAARPSPPVYGDFTDLLLTWSEAALILTVGLWLASLALRARTSSDADPDARPPSGPGRRTLGPTFLVLPAAGLVGLAWLGVPGSIDPVGAASGATRLVVVALFALYVFFEVRGPRQLVLPVGLMVAVQAAIGLGQLAAQHSLGLGSLGELSLVPSLPVSVVTTLDGGRILRAYGLSDHPNILGGLLAVGLLVLAWAFVFDRPSRPILRGATLAAFALGTAGLVATFSRGGWLALAVGLVVLGVIGGRAGGRPALHLFGAILLAGLLVAAPLAVTFLPVLEARSGTQGPIATETRSIEERGAVADLAVSIAAAHPFLGVGLGQLPLAEQAARPHFAFDYQPASLVPLDAAAETGLLGGLLVLVLAVVPWLALVRVRGDWTPGLALTSAALAALTVVGLVDYYVWSDPPGRIWAWLILGLWAAAYRDARMAGAPVTGALGAA